MVPFVSVDPSGEILEGSSVTLSCSSDANPAATYTWHKDENPVNILSYNSQLVFDSTKSTDSGKYYCVAWSQLGRRTSQYISVNVEYGPKLPSVSVDPTGEIMEGSSVTLSCSSDANPAATYTWYKKDGNPELNPLSKDSQLIFSSIKSTDSGEFYCTSENKLGKKTSEYVSVNVE
ncbi:hypothetical protein LDENG_00197880, partial [Lucifuga dentata]